MNRDIALNLAAIVGVTGTAVVMGMMGDGVSASSLALIDALLIWGLHCECLELARTSWTEGGIAAATRIVQGASEAARQAREETP